MSLCISGVPRKSQQDVPVLKDTEGSGPEGESASILQPEGRQSCLLMASASTPHSALPLPLALPSVPAYREGVQQDFCILKSQGTLEAPGVTQHLSGSMSLGQTSC